MHVELPIPKEKLIILCDTGAALTIIGENFINKLPAIKITFLAHNIILTLFNSHKSAATSLIITNSVIMLTINLADFKVEFSFYVFPRGLPVALLGADFLACFWSIINFPKQQIEFEISQEFNQ